MKEYIKPICTLNLIEDADVITASVVFNEGEGAGDDIIVM